MHGCTNLLVRSRRVHENVTISSDWYFSLRRYLSSASFSTFIFAASMKEVVLDRGLSYVLRYFSSLSLEFCMAVTVLLESSITSCTDSPVFLCS